ncbi:MAG: hypothetical protein LBL17_02850 [Coxiellaceae bacterium]|jgi:hypothetical protein|nr:hypothetical protein [Coxiellaceae bacterium]
MIIKRFLVGWIILSLAVTAYADKKIKIEATKINVFKPELTPTRMKHGSCWVDSIALVRRDAWRCIVANEILILALLLERKIYWFVKLILLKISRDFF